MIMNTALHISILLIDENPRTRWEVIAALLSVGVTAEVKSITTLHSTREMFAGQQNYDLIIIDPLTFSGHGVEIIAELKVHPYSKHIPLLVYSSCRKKDWSGAVCVSKSAYSALLAGAILQSIPRTRLGVLSPHAARALAVASST